MILVPPIVRGPKRYARHWVSMTNSISATPIDLDPLRHHDLHVTFLHLFCCWARVLAQLRVNLQRPVANQRALEWRLRGLIGVGPLIERTARAVIRQNVLDEEAWLTLADLLIVIREVDYQAVEGALSNRLLKNSIAEPE